MAVNLENTTGDEDDVVETQPCHRHYDSFSDNVAPGKLFPSCWKNVGGARRRQDARLGVSRTPFIEPLGDKRENSYEARLLLGLPWYCVEKQSEEEWLFHWDPPHDITEYLPQGTTLKIAPGVANSFEHICSEVEAKICNVPTLVCACCARERDLRCPSCCLLYTSPSPRDVEESRMPSSA